MSGAQDHPRPWVALSPKIRERVAQIITGDGPERTIRAVAAGLTAEQQPHATAIADAFERALGLDDLTDDERLGQALVDAHRAGQDPVEVLLQWQ